MEGFGTVKSQRAIQGSKSMGTKERIEREAQRLFVEQGIAETSIRDISRLSPLWVPKILSEVMIA